MLNLRLRFGALIALFTSKFSPPHSRPEHVAHTLEGIHGWTLLTLQPSPSYLHIGAKFHDNTSINILPLRNRNPVLDQRRKRLQRCIRLLYESSVFMGRRGLWRKDGKQLDVRHVSE